MYPFFDTLGKHQPCEIKGDWRYLMGQLHAAWNFISHCNEGNLRLQWGKWDRQICHWIFPYGLQIYYVLIIAIQLPRRAVFQKKIIATNWSHKTISNIVAYEQETLRHLPSFFALQQKIMFLLIFLSTLMESQDAQAKQ